MTEKENGSLYESARALSCLIALCLFSLASCQGTILGRARSRLDPARTPVLSASPQRALISSPHSPPASSSVRPPVAIYDEISISAPLYLPTGRMGDWGDIRFDALWEGGAEGTRTCVRVEYLPRATQGNGWAGMYWQRPPGNWGHVSDGGMDLAGARRLAFWARGDTGKELVSQFMMGGLEGAHPDTGHAALGPIQLGREWRRYEINLEGVDLKRIAGGFAWTADLTSNPGGVIFYLDEIRYEW